MCSPRQFVIGKSQALAVEGEDRWYSIFLKGPVAAPVIVEVCWLKMKRTDLRPPARLPVPTDITPDGVNPRPSLGAVGRVVLRKTVKSYLRFLSINNRRTIAFLVALWHAAVVRHLAFGKTAHTI